MLTAIKDKILNNKISNNVRKVHGRVKTNVKFVLDKTTVDDRIIASVKHVKKEYKQNLVTALSAALAFVMALYIRDVIKEWINLFLEFFNISQGAGLVYNTIIAVVVLTICVLGIVFLSRWKEK